MSRTHKVLSITLTFILLFIVTITASNCGKSQNKQANSNNTPESTSPGISDKTKAVAKILASSDLDEDIRDLLQSPPEKPPSSSFDLIDRDLESGILQREAAVLLKLTAAFAPEKLVQKYRGARTGSSAPESDELRRDIQWVMNNFEQFDQTLQEKFRPFILRPDEPDSYFNPANKEKQESLLKKLAFTRPAYAGEERWHKLEFSVAGKPDVGTIYYYENLLTADGIPMKQKAQTVKEALEKAWPMFKGLLRTEPDKHLAFYLTDLNLAVSNLAGSAYYTQDNTTKKLLSFHIDVDYSQSGNKLKSVAVHELFHIFQYHCMMEYEETEAWWLQEATAVWAENYVYPLVNREHIHLDKFFGTLEEKLIQKGSSKDYAGYMFFLFLSERYRDNSMIRDIILNTKGLNVSDYIMNALPDFPEMFAQFALWNWNAKPWKMYSDNGTFPAKRPYGTAVDARVLENSGQAEDYITLEPGAIGYRYYHVADKNIKRIKLDFTDMAWDGKLHVQALYKVGDQWSIRDCTEQNSVVFCRNRPAENISGVVLIFSNADLQNPQDLEYEIDTTGECPQAITGYTKITEKMTYRDGNASASLLINYFSEDVLEYDQERDAYVITQRKLAYTLTADKSFPDTAMFGLGGNATSGSGTLSETYELHEAPIKFKKAKDGGGYLVPDPDTRKNNWVNYSDTVLGVYEDPPLGLIMIYLGATGGDDVLPEEIKDNSFKGFRSQKVSVDAKMEMETTMEFSYKLH